MQENVGVEFGFHAINIYKYFMRKEIHDVIMKKNVLLI